MHFRNGRFSGTCSTGNFDALHEFLKIKEYDAEEYENLEREYNRLYDELEDTKSELEDAEAEVDRLEEENDSLSDKLSSISKKKIEVLLSDKDFGYIDQEEFNSKIKELSSEYSIIEK